MKSIANGYVDWKNSKECTNKIRWQKKNEKVLSYEQLIMKYADKIASIAFVHKTTEEKVLQDIKAKLEEDDTDE